MNANEKECLINKLNETNKKIASNEFSKARMKKNDQLIEWFEIELTLLNNQKIMIEQAFINDHLEEL